MMNQILSTNRVVFYTTIINRGRVKEFLTKLHELSGHRGIMAMYYNLKDNIYLPMI